MPRLIIIAVAPTRGLFTAETDSHECGVFLRISGPPVEVGDMLDGGLIQLGRCEFQHAEGVCIAIGQFGPTARADALTKMQKPDVSGSGYMGLARCSPVGR